MTYKMTIDFIGPSEENLEALNEVLSKFKFSSIEMTDVEGLVGYRNDNEYLATPLHDYLYSLKKATFFCCAESIAAENYTYQVQITVFGKQSGTDTVAFHFTWSNEHPDRVIKSVQSFTQDNCTVYVVVSRKREEDN